MLLWSWNLLVIINILCISSHCEAKKSYLFVSGWPQSGTSLLQQLFTVTPNVSTMVDNCNKYMGNKCINVNHEVRIQRKIVIISYHKIIIKGTMDDWL